MSTTIRVSERTRDRLAALSRETGQPMTEVIEWAVEALERSTFLNRLNARFDELRRDDIAWTQIEDERAIEEGSSGDASR